MDFKIIIMKKLLFVSCIFLAFTTKSQTLEFNQVLLVSSLNTVPQGKVWKVTNILPTLEGNGTCKISVNGNDIVIAFTDYGSWTGGGSTQAAYAYEKTYNGLQGPYWLPEGTTLQAGTNVQYISVIEFNTP